MAGLTWLGDRPGTENWPFCLTFVRGSGEREVFQAFGADPGDAVLARPGAPVPEAAGAPVVRVGRSGEWLVALEENIPPQGTRPEVLCRVSAGAEAVAIYNDIGKFNHEFAHALDGEIIAAVITSVPPHWWGSDPDRLIPLATELGLGDGGGDDLTPLEALLALAEEALARIVAVRVNRILAATGLGKHAGLASAVQSAVAGEEEHVTDDDPVGVTLRRAVREHPDAVLVLRFVLAGRLREALAADVQRERRSRAPGWRDQFIADLGDVPVDPDEIRAAEEARRTQHPATASGLADAEPVRAHVQRLIDAGLGPAAIAALGGASPVGIDRLLRGVMPQIPASMAQRLLAIEVP